LDSGSGRSLQSIVVAQLNWPGIGSGEPGLNISFGSVFLLIISGAISSALLSSGYFPESLASIGLTAVAMYLLDRKEKKSQSIFRDKPIY
jgi:hypothetical protein